MTFEQMEGSRRDVAQAILQKFGAGMDRAEQNAAFKTSDPWLKKLTAARAALEYAVLATAREKNAATNVVAGHLQAASAAQQAAMIKDGAAALGRVYRVEPEVLVNALAGKMVGVDLPKGMASIPEIDKMVDSCRNLVTSVIQDEYAVRGRLAAGSYDKDSFIALKSDGVVSPAKSELATRMAFMESTIDAAAANGSITIDAAAANGSITIESATRLKDRIEAQLFQPRPPQSLQFSKAFNTFFEQRGKAVRIEAMKEVRSVTQSLQVQEIAAKLQLIMPPAGARRLPVDHRAAKPLER
jgi:hypothetical protein